MDIETIKQLKETGAAIALILKEVNIRNIYTEYRLLAIFEIMDRVGKNPIPVTLTIETNKSRQRIIKKCEFFGFSFAEFPLPDAGRPDKACRPSNGQCQLSCSLCTKADFDSACGCHNPSVFSVGVGDWVCNLTAPFQGRQ